MSVLRQQNFLSQQRLDIPHIRAIESGVAADFDLLAGKMIAGNAGLIVSGFNIALTPGLGAPATSLEVVVAGGSVINPHSAEPGGLFAADEDAANEVLGPANPKVSGGFTAATDNYVCLELYREDDAASKDTVYFLNPTTGTESTREVALGRVLKYRFVITTEDPGSFPDLVPLARVAVTSGGDVLTITDVRPCLFRLASGGAQADEQNVYSWPQGRSVATMSGGDKAIRSMKEAFEAIMTRLWELGGGDAWFHAGTDRDVKLTYGPDVLTNGDNWKWTLGTETLEWKDVDFVFANSEVTSNALADGTSVLLDGQCLYVDLVRNATTTLTPQVAAMTTLGAPTVPGSRYILAWRLGDSVFIKDKAYEAGRAFGVPASTSALGIVKLTSAPHDAGNPTVVPVNSSGTLAYSALTSSPVAGTNINAAQFTAKGTGIGVSGTSGTGIGVSGSSSSNAGVSGYRDGDGGGAVVGTHDGTSADSYGMIGTGQSGSANGVLGQSNAGAGVHGKADGSTGKGVLGETLSIDPTAVAVHGRAMELNSQGVAVKGDSQLGFGVEGTSATNVGVIGRSGGSVGAVTGVSSSTDSAAQGVYGATLETGATGDGVKGASAAGNGVSGVSTSGPGVKARSGSGYGIDASSTSNHAIVAAASATAKSAVLGSTSALDASASGVSGSALGAGAVGSGVSGTTLSGVGVSATATTGTGLRALATSGKAIEATSETGNAAILRKTGAIGSRTEAIVRLQSTGVVGAAGIDMEVLDLVWEDTAYPDSRVGHQAALGANAAGQCVGARRSRILRGGGFSATPTNTTHLTVTLNPGVFSFGGHVAGDNHPRIKELASPLVEAGVVPLTGTGIYYWYLTYDSALMTVLEHLPNPPDAEGKPSGTTDTHKCYVGCTPYHNTNWDCYVVTTGLRKRRVGIATAETPGSAIETQSSCFYGIDLAVAAASSGSSDLFVSSGGSANNGIFPIASAIPTLTIARWMIGGEILSANGNGEFAANTELSSHRFFHNAVAPDNTAFSWEMHTQKNHTIRYRYTANTSGFDLTARCIGWDEDLDLLDDL